MFLTTSLLLLKFLSHILHLQLLCHKPLLMIAHTQVFCLRKPQLRKRLANIELVCRAGFDLGNQIWIDIMAARDNVNELVWRSKDWYRRLWRRRI